MVQEHHHEGASPTTVARAEETIRRHGNANMVHLQKAVGAYSTAGKAAYQQDRHLVHSGSNWQLYAVADGHGHAETGHVVAEHCVERLAKLVETGLDGGDEALKKNVELLDKSAIELTSGRRLYAGSTLCFVVQQEKELIVGNVGDSRAILVGREGVKALSEDHVCWDVKERERIEKAGGWVIGGLLNGYISMSRALGDDDLKGHRNITPFSKDGQRVRGGFEQDLFTGEADIKRWKLGSEDIAVVVASDGVWGKLKNEDVGAIVRTELGKGKTGGDIAKAIVKKALGKGSRDNITAVVATVDDRRAGDKLSDTTCESSTSGSVSTTESAGDRKGLRFGRRGLAGRGGKDEKETRFLLRRGRQISNFVQGGFFSAVQ